MKPLVVQSEGHKLGLELGALGVVTALNHKAGADRSAKAAIRASRAKASSPCIVTKADGTQTILARTKTERDNVRRVAPKATVLHHQPQTYADRMAKYGTPAAER
jgi:hypothetical protein